MLVFLDTEFTDLNCPVLLSVGLVDDLGRTFYAEIDGFELGMCSPFVWTEVLPLMTGPAFPAVDLARLLNRWFADAGEQCQVVTDAPEYDFELLKALFADDWPDNLNRLPVRFDSYVCADYAGLYTDARHNAYSVGWPEHHALADALALRASWLAVNAAGWGGVFNSENMPQSV